MPGHAGARSLSFSCLTPGVQSTRAEKKYRRFTGGKWDGITMQVLATAREKPPAQEQGITGKNRAQNNGNSRTSGRVLTHRLLISRPTKTNRPPPRGAGRTHPRLGFQP